MGDMTPIIAPKSDQLNADDLLSGPRTITIEAVKVTPGTEQPVTITIKGEKKLFRPCKTVCKVLANVWGADSSAYIGKSLTIYCDPDVLWAGVKVGGIRVSHMSHMDGQRTIAVLETRQKRKNVMIRPLALASKQQPPATAKQAGHEPQGEPAEVAAAGSEEVAIADVAAEVVAKFKAATTVELIDAAWKMSAADRRACVDADASYADVFLAEFKKAKTALQDEVPA